MAAVFEPKYDILLQLGETIRLAKKDGGINRFLFCVLFRVHTGIICFQGLKILRDVIGTLDVYCGGIIVKGVPQVECVVPVNLLHLD